MSTMYWFRSAAGVALEHPVCAKRKDAVLRHFSRRHAARWDQRTRLEALPLPQRLSAPHIVSIDAFPLLYVKNPKCACTTISQVLYILQEGRDFHGQIHHEHDVLQQGNAAAEKNLHRLQDGTYVRFSFVRNPLARAVSGFANFFLSKTNPEHRQHMAHMEARGFSDGKNIHENFGAFLEYVAESMALDPSRTDRHFRTQRRVLNIDSWNYDFIGRVEALEEGIAHVLELAGCPGTVRDRLTGLRMNSSGPSKFTPTPDQERRVRELYAEDYEAFGY